MGGKMAKQSVKNFTFYRLRFWLGYSIIALAFIGLMAIAVTYIPGGINTAEEASVLKSASLNPREPSSLLVTDLPYHALQKLSLFLFDLSSFSVKLPSAFIAFLTGVGFILLLRRWFTPAVSVIVSGIAVSSTAFIFLSQQGTPAIMALFWPVMLMLFASWSVSKNRFAPLALIGLGITAGLSLYTPLAIFPLLALIIGGLLHPHVRYVVRRRISKPILLLAALLGLVALLPLFYMIYRTPVLLSSVFLASSELSFNLLENTKLLALQFGDITGKSSDVTALSAPFFTLPIMLVIIFGAVRLLRARHSAQNYILSSWLILLIPVMLLNPYHPEFAFIPLILLAGVGVAQLLSYWYKLFPNNPYARAFGLVPLVILIGGMMVSGFLRYYYVFQYSAPEKTKVSYDLILLEKQIDHLKNPDKTAIIVSPKEQALYQLYVDTRESPIEVTTSYNAAVLGGKETVIATQQSEVATQNVITPTYIVGSRSANTPSDTFYIYKNNE